MHGAAFPIWRVEEQHHGRRRRAFPECIKTSPIQLASVILLINLRRECGSRGVEGNFGPKSFGLVWFHRCTAHVFHQQAAGSQRLIANHFGRQTKTGAAGEKDVARIAFQKLGRYCRRLTIRGSRNEQSLHAFHFPALPGEFGRQPIEQFRVGRCVTLLSKVVRGRHQPLAKKMLPIPVNGDARGQRVLGIDNPPGQAEPIPRSALRQGGSIRGAAAETASPGRLYSPRSRIRVGRGLSCCSMIIAVGRLLLNCLAWARSSRSDW